MREGAKGGVDVEGGRTWRGQGSVGGVGLAGALFDRQNDPGEPREMATENPEIVARVRTVFDELSRLGWAKPAAGNKGKKV